MIYDALLTAGFTPAVVFILLLLMMAISYLVVRYEQCSAEVDRKQQAFLDFLIELSEDDDPIASKAVRRIRKT